MASARKLLGEARELLEALRPLRQSKNLVVGVSGGPDSLALLHLLTTQLPPERLIVAHLNHGWRQEADEEAEFVAETAVAWNLSCHITAADTRQLARRHGWTLEEASRRARYDYFARLAEQHDASVIVVGHNADDQAESVLMHLLRGSGLAGLRGMRPESPVPGSPNLTLLRPLLHTSRADIEAYCRRHQLNPRQDPTNEDTTYLRNRLRHELLPRLETYNPRIKERLQQMATTIAADHKLLQELQQQTWETILANQEPGWLQIDRRAWQLQPLGLRRRLLRHAVRIMQPQQKEISFQAIEEARLIIEQGRTGNQVTLPGALVLTISYDFLTVTAVNHPVPTHHPQLPDCAALELTVPGQVPLENGWRLQAIILDDPDLERIRQNADPWTAYVMLPTRLLEVRPRQPGERFQPLGLEGHSASFKEVMINRKIEAAARPCWPIVATPEHPVWLTGHQIDERAKVTTLVQPIIQLHCWLIST